MPDIRTVTLARPIPYGEGQTLDTLRLRQPCAGDLRGLKLTRLEEAEVDSILTIIPRISVDAVSPAQLAALHPVDLLALTAEVLGFFGPAEAGTASPATPAPLGAS